MQRFLFNADRRLRDARGPPAVRILQGGGQAVARALVTGWVTEKDGPIALWITVGRAEPTAMFEAIARYFGAPELMNLPDAEREEGCVTCLSVLLPGR